MNLYCSDSSRVLLWAGIHAYTMSSTAPITTYNLQKDISIDPRWKAYYCVTIVKVYLICNTFSLACPNLLLRLLTEEHFTGSFYKLISNAECSCSANIYLILTLVQNFFKECFHPSENCFSCWRQKNRHFSSKLAMLLWNYLSEKLLGCSRQKCMEDLEMITYTKTLRWNTRKIINVIYLEILLKVHKLHYTDKVSLNTISCYSGLLGVVLRFRSYWLGTCFRLFLFWI